MKRKSLKTTPPKSTGRAKPMTPPGGFGKRRRYSCGGKIKK